MNHFSGYSREALQLLSDLGTADKSWFDERRPEYERGLATPTKEFVTDIGAFLTAEDPAIHAIAKVNGSISPINNDLRFHAGSPYKDAILLRFWHGPEKRLSPTLFMRITQAEVGFGCGITMEGPTLARYRDQVADDSGADLVAALAPVLRKRGAALMGQDLKRVPAPYPPDHPRADLLRHKWLQVRWLEATPQAVHSAKFVPWSTRRLEQLAEVQRWLVQALA